MPTADEAGPEDDFDVGKRRKTVIGTGHCEPTRCARPCGGGRYQKELLPRRNGEPELSRKWASPTGHQIRLREKYLVKGQHLSIKDELNTRLYRYT